MKIKTDENIPKEACEILRNEGYDALSVWEQNLGGHPDSDISTVCRAEERILITLDTDFANIIAYPPDEHNGMIVIRTMDQSKPIVMNYIRRIADFMRSESPDRRLWIVDADRLRVRESKKGEIL
jgi:predicted nuclease of predicted toxin-antitoxin system